MLTTKPPKPHLLETLHWLFWNSLPEISITLDFETPHCATPHLFHRFFLLFLCSFSGCEVSLKFQHLVFHGLHQSLQSTTACTLLILRFVSPVSLLTPKLKFSTICTTHWSLVSKLNSSSSLTLTSKTDSFLSVLSVDLGYNHLPSI